jgi:predicted GNAT family N-acyltransferase
VEGASCAVIDRLCILQPYRRRGFAKKALETVIADVSQAIAQTGTLSVRAVLLTVPADAAQFQQKLQAANFAQMDCVFQDRGIPCVRMALHCNSQVAQ